jgi:hypothetical protein
VQPRFEYLGVAARLDPRASGLINLDTTPVEDRKDPARR